MASASLTSATSHVAAIPAELAGAPSPNQKASVKVPPHRQAHLLICRSSLTSMPPDHAFEGYGSTSMALSFIQNEQASKLDEEWLRLGLSFPAAGSELAADMADGEAHETFVSMAGYTSSDLDEVWLKLGLTFTDSEPDFLTHTTAATQVGATRAVEVEEIAAQELAQQSAAVDPNSYFATDLRPIVLFDGTCNFCSKWTVFLLDTDPLGNLRFASMQSEAGKALLKRAGLKENDNSEIVLAAHKRSYVGVEAILQIFSRLQMPFPIIAAVGGAMPLFIDNYVYKVVSKYRHKFGGPAACRLFDPRFNERFVS